MEPLEIRIRLAEIVGFTWANGGTRIGYSDMGPLAGQIPERYVGRALTLEELPPFESSLNLLRWIQINCIDTDVRKALFHGHLASYVYQGQNDGLSAYAKITQIPAIKMAEMILRTFEIWDEE